MGCNFTLHSAWVSLGLLVGPAGMVPAGFWGAGDSVPGVVFCELALGLFWGWVSVFNLPQ